MQRESFGAVPQRARYHLGMIDSKHFPAGVKDYKQLNDAYVIFITETDVLGYDLPIYNIGRTIKENGQDFKDGSHIIYVNGAKRHENTALSILMHDFFCKDAKDIKNTVLANRVRHFKQDDLGDGMNKLSLTMKELEITLKNSIEVNKELKEEMRNLC